MADTSLIDNGTVQNLRDAGCTDEYIECFARIAGKEGIKEQLDFLTKHRVSLLDSVHEYQKKIDCLDYLIYRIKNQPNEGRKILLRKSLTV